MVCVQQLCRVLQGVCAAAVPHAAGYVEHDFRTLSTVTV